MLTQLKNLGLPVLLVLVLLVVFGLFFLFEFISYTPPEIIAQPVSADSYHEEVTALLDQTDPAHGEVLLTTYGCAACHEAGAAHGVAPSFDGLAERAGERRPPMPAAAYVYESIVHPGAYVVEDFSNVMPQNFDERLTDEELGDVIAYLLTR